ncbi:MAG: hypothetical protein FWE50_02270 [Alphaproteobacteria bacterium]|nr:hypothetical protein [Alphaproteobacteria bacterium]
MDKTHSIEHYKQYHMISFRCPEIPGRSRDDSEEVNGKVRKITKEEVLQSIKNEFCIACDKRETDACKMFFKANSLSL